MTSPNAAGPETHPQSAIRNPQFPWPWFGAIFAGLLLGLGYAPFNQSGLIWVALTPLVTAVWFGPRWRKRDWLRCLLLGYLAGLTFFGTCLYWVHEVTIAGWIVLPFYLALYPAAWALFLGTVLRPRDTGENRSYWLGSARNLGISALAAAAWVSLEWIRGTLFTGFGWNGLGVALNANIALIQITEFTGVGGLSFLITMVNLILVITVRRLLAEIGHGKMLRPHYDFGLTIGLVALTFTYGVSQLMKKPAPEFPVSVAAVQANIPQDQKWDDAFADYILKTYEEQTQIALASKPDLLIWPEAATPYPLFLNKEVHDSVMNLVMDYPGALLLGTTHYTDAGDFNSAVLLTRNGDRAQIYNKMHLVPFGEYIPLRHSFPVFAWLVGDLVAADFDMGTEAIPLDLEEKAVRVGPLICFEDTLGPISRQFAAKGAQLFVTITNDGWFKQSAGSSQHAAHAVFRCAEAKLPMVRAANTGITCLIDRFGRVTTRLASENGDTFIQGVLMGQVNVPFDPEPTFYTRYGEVFSFACLAVTVVAMGTFFARRRFFA